MNILVCFKFIYDEDEISINPDRTVDLSHSQWVVSPYDLNAIEASMKLAAALGDSTVNMLTVAGDVLSNSKAKKTALSRGPAAMYAVKVDNALDMDNLAVASTLKNAVEKIGDVDLIVCGEGSGDMYSMQLGNMLGGMLGWNTINGVSAMTGEDGKVICQRTDGSRVEKFAISGKAVISVTSDISRARIPSMKEIMGAGKKPQTVWDAAELMGKASVTEVGSVLAPLQAERKLVVFHEAVEEEFDEFVKVLKNNI